MSLERISLRAMRRLKNNPEGAFVSPDGQKRFHYRAESHGIHPYSQYLRTQIFVEENRRLIPRGESMVLINNDQSRDRMSTLAAMSGCNQRIS